MKIVLFASSFAVIITEIAEMCLSERKENNPDRSLDANQPIMCCFLNLLH